MAKNKIITSEGNVQFQLGDGSGKIINVHPFHIYSVFNEDTVSFILIAMPKSSGLAIFTSKAEDLEVNGTTYTFAELPDALAEAFAVAGAQARAEIVDELPETGQTNTIYLVPKEDGQGFDEYIYIDGQWELLGDTDIELDRYVEKTDFSAYTAATDAKIDTISGDVATVSGQVASEVTRATGAEGVLDTKIDTVSGNVITETSRAESAETALDDKIDVVSGAVDDVQNEVDILSAALDDEVSARTDADSAIQALIDTVSGDVETISGDVATISGSVESLGDDKANKAEAVASAEYVSSSTTIDLKDISGNVISQVDASDFIIDGMIDDVKIENGYLIIDFNTASGKEDIQIPLTDIFDPSNYYDKTSIDNIVSGLNDSIDAVSGDVQTLNEKVETISGESVTSGEVQTQIDNSISGKADKTDIYTYEGTDRIKVTNATGIRRKAIDLNIPIYKGTGTASLSLGAEVGTLQGANQIKGFFSTGIGLGLTTNNSSEVATGQYNISNTVGTSSWGSSGNTLFSVGNGDHQGGEHNAFEIRQNGDIYITSGGTAASHMFRLQDQLGGGTVESAITSGSTNAVESKAIWSATTFNKSVLLAFNNGYSTNYPNGCTKLIVEVVGDGASSINFFNYNQNLGGIFIINYGGIFVNNSFNGASYEISGTTVIITYPTVSVTKIWADNSNNVYKAIVEGAWVNENTYMKPEVDSIATSLQNNINSKQDTLVSGTNIKTINNESLLGNGNITIQGGSSYAAGDGIDITNDVISVTGKVDTSVYNTYTANTQTAISDLNEYKAPYLWVDDQLRTKIDETTFDTFVSDFNTYSGSVESRIAEDEEVTAAGLNALNDKFGGLKLMKISQSDYDNLQVKDNNTLYIISD